jgi:hypothetical protein
MTTVPYTFGNEQSPIPLSQLDANFAVTPQFANTAGNVTGNATTATSAGAITNAGGWNVTPSGTTLFFNYNGTNVAKLDSSGNLTTLANVTAYGTV